MDKGFEVAQSGFDSVDNALIEAIIERQYSRTSNGSTSLSEWKQLAEAFVSARKSVKASTYLQREHRERSNEFAVIADTADFIEQGEPYASCLTRRDVLSRVHADAPFVYAITHTSGIFVKILGVMSFKIDLEKRLLLIEQIQGGDTTQDIDPKDLSERTLFNEGMPEYMLYDAVRQFALACDLRAIGIRKNMDKKSTLREKVAKHANHDEHSPIATGALENYTFEELLTRADVKYE